MSIEYVVIAALVAIFGIAIFVLLRRGGRNDFGGESPLPPVRKPIGPDPEINDAVKRQKIRALAIAASRLGLPTNKIALDPESMSTSSAESVLYDQQVDHGFLRVQTEILRQIVILQTAIGDGDELAYAGQNIEQAIDLDGKLDNFYGLMIDYSLFGDLLYVQVFDAETNAEKIQLAEKAVQMFRKARQANVSVVQDRRNDKAVEGRLKELDRLIGLLKK